MLPAARARMLVMLSWTTSDAQQVAATLQFLCGCVDDRDRAGSLSWVSGWHRPQ